MMQTIDKLIAETKQVVDRIMHWFKDMKVTMIPEQPPVTPVFLRTEDIKHFNKNTQQFIGQLVAERERLKVEKAELIDRLYEDKVLNIRKDLNDQLKNIVREVVMEGELHHMAGYPLAISSGDNKPMGRLLAVSHYNNQWYPILWVNGGIKVVLQGANSYSDVVRAKERKYVVIGYNGRGKFIPKVYMQT